MEGFEVYFDILLLHFLDWDNAFGVSKEFDDLGGSV